MKTISTKEERDSIKTLLVGMTRENATKTLKEMDLDVRATRIDGVGQIGTCDYRLDRVNLWVEKGLVTNAYPG